MIHALEITIVDNGILKDINTCMHYVAAGVTSL